MWVFRRDLRFPNVLLLFPIGIAAIWFLNALRIALLVSIGSHVSPAVAVQGFHSVAGWICFLAVTLSCHSRLTKNGLLCRAAMPERAAGHGSTSGARRTSVSRAVHGLVAASILASAFAPHDQWLYAVKVAAVGAALWWFRDAYLPLLSGASLSSVAIGLAVGVRMDRTDPGKGIVSPLGAWLASLPVWLAAIWLCLRAVGSIALVPMAEELAFRGYLSRALISTRFENVGIGEFRLAGIHRFNGRVRVHARTLARCLPGRSHLRHADVSHEAAVRSDRCAHGVECRDCGLGHRGPAVVASVALRARRQRQRRALVATSKSIDPHSQWLVAPPTFEKDVCSEHQAPCLHA